MYKYRRVIIGVVAALLALLLVLSIVVGALVYGASSSEIKSKLEGLKDQAEEIEEKQKELKDEIASNVSEQLDLVEQKSQIDRTIELTQQQIDNKNEQIQEYNLLIAEKQNELDDALAKKDDLNARYKERVRSMEETGKVSYWSILFKASSFSDLLDRVDMINEIADADSKMLQQLNDVAKEIETAREELASEKVMLEEAKDELAVTQTELEEQRKESDELLVQLNADKKKLEEAADKYETMEDELSAQIAKQEQAYKDALQSEQNAGGNGGNGGGNGGTSSGGFIKPCNYSSVTCAYGYRIHPITGKYSFHNGVDLGASQGTPIYATKSGTVTTATYTYVYGYYVTINHGDGYSSLYGHMTHYTVSSGQHVSQGEIIGYVGSTGWSTGPHLHFTIYYNGSTVNPMNYIG